MANQSRTVGISIPNTDRRPRIWCNHCDAQTRQVADMSRHYRHSHPALATIEAPFWVFEIYQNSRHGNTIASNQARLRTQQVVAHMAGGPPVNAPPFGNAAPGTHAFAAVATVAGVPRKALAAEQYFTGTVLVQVSLAAPAVATLALPPAPAGPADAPPPAPPAATVRAPPVTATAPPPAGQQTPPQSVWAGRLRQR